MFDDARGSPKGTLSATTGRPLREMAFADILDTTFSVYRNNFWLFIGITAALHVPFGIISILVVGLSENPALAQVFAGVLNIIKGILIDPMVMGALVFAISQEYLGKETTVGEAFRHVKLRSILGASMLIGLAAMGLTLTVIGMPFAIYFMFRWSLFCQCIVVEGYAARGAMSRSTDLVKGDWWRVFGIEAILFLIATLVVLILGYGFGAILDRAIGTEQLMTSTLITLIPIIVTPISLIGTTLLYFDLRIRKEAFDIEMMAKNIHGETEGVGASV